MKKILISLPMEDRHRRWLEAQVADVADNYEILWRPAYQVSAEDVAGAHVILGYVSRALVAQDEALEWYQLSWAGADAVLAAGLPERVVLTNAAGAYGLAVGEHMVAATLALMKRLHQYGRLQAAHDWRLLGRVRSVEGATVLVLGTGDIGGLYARKMKALGASTLGVKRRPSGPMEGFDEIHTLDALDELLPRADVLAMALPGGAQTAHLMDARRLALLKEGAYIVNAGRGNSLDLAALKTALDSGHIAGAALDVFETEPLPADSPLWDNNKVLITPHASGKFLMQETIDRVIELCGENLRRYTHGQPLLHVVDRTYGY